MKRLISVFLLIALIFSVIPAFGGCKNREKSSYPSVEKSVKLPESSIDFDFFAASNGYFYRRTEGGSDLYYVRGVNMGLTSALTDLSNPNVSYDTYLEWFGQIKEMNANTVRAFTVMNPDFYRALYDFNTDNPSSPLYLMQGIWFSEDLMYQLTDALESDKILINAFMRSVRETVDIIHGNSDYTVYGEFSPAVYDRDISEYVAGYILGLEYPADFVIETNASHPDEAEYSGDYLYTAASASPFEAFLCQVGDCLISYETENYSYQIPVAFLNWQTLDTLTHSNEPFEEEDCVFVNTENIQKKASYASGLFAAVDVYPYYPEFMNHQKEYTDYRDENGDPDAFRAYIRDLKTQYSVPLLIAEYGLSTSRGVAHTSADGYNQGGLTETEQGEYCARMTKSIALEGCCGGLLFSWQDEWFKRTWNTVMYYPDDPTDRTHNLSSAEQGYGLLSFDVSEVFPDGDFSDWENTEYIDGTTVKVQYDADYMHILADLPEGFDFDNDTYYIPISVLGVGSNKSLEDGLSFDRSCDFLLKINGKENTRLLCDAYYDTFSYKYFVLKKVLEGEKASKNSGIYNRINTFISNEMYLPDDGETVPPKFCESGILRYGNANPDSDEYCSQADFYFSDGKVEIRIAWYLLNVVNSRLGVCIDELCGEEIGFTEFSDIYIGSGEKGEIKLSSAKYEPLGEINVASRLKKSYNNLQDILGEIKEKIS
ncbi:MAG: hypothetical protein PUC29_08605 [Clostridia bacterium]|nr:hypothetical protein [Clostridia bacterium]